MNVVWNYEEVQLPGHVRFFSVRKDKRNDLFS